MRQSRFRFLAASTALLGLGACNNDIGSPNSLSAASAFDSAPAGMDIVSSSFTGDSQRLPWSGPRRGPGGPGHGGFMGGGLNPAFHGGIGFGRGAHRGPFAVRIDDTCSFAAATGELTCGPTARGPLSVTTIYNIQDAAGAAQQAVDTLTTNAIRIRTTVTGTVTRGIDGNVTATVNNSGDRSVVGLAPNSTSRTVNGVALGVENASGTNREGRAFTAVRTSADTTTNLVIPVTVGTQTYPTSGSVVRTMKVVTTVNGGEAQTLTRRESITFNGTNAATLVITQNGTSRTCTLPLPLGRPNCS